jgi:hypothetical protein
MMWLYVLSLIKENGSEIPLAADKSLGLAMSGINRVEIVNKENAKVECLNETFNRFIFKYGVHIFMIRRYGIRPTSIVSITSRIASKVNMSENLCAIHDSETKALQFIKRNISIDSINTDENGIRTVKGTMPDVKAIGDDTEVIYHVRTFRIK